MSRSIMLSTPVTTVGTEWDVACGNELVVPCSKGSCRPQQYILFRLLPRNTLIILSERKSIFFSLL